MYDACTYIYNIFAIYQNLDSCGNLILECNSNVMSKYRLDTVLEVSM